MLDLPAVSLEVPKVFRPLWEPKRFKCAHGGRGSGKSHDRGAAAVIAMLEGRNVLCVREVQNSIADSVKRLIEQKIEALGVQDLFRITDKEISCGLSGAVCIFRGMQNHTAASVKSLEGFDVAWWEEAQTASRRSLDLLIPTIRTPGSELWFTWNPNAPSDPIEEFRSNPPDNAVVVEANWSDNPWFPEELRLDMERDRARDPDKYHHVWGGGYELRSETRVFRNWRVEALDVPHGVVPHFGLDFGFAHDPTAGVRLRIWERNGTPTVYVEQEIGGIGIPTAALPAMLAELEGAREYPVTADSARPETIDHLRRNGFPRVRPAMKGKGSIKDGIEFLKGFEIVVNPACVNVERELTLYAYKVDRLTEDILPEVEDANNHWIDAMRYAVEKLHHRGEWKVPQIGRRRRVDDYGRNRDYDDQGALDWKTI